MSRERIVDLVLEIAAAAIDARHEDDNSLGFYGGILRDSMSDLIYEVRGVPPSEIELDSLCDMRKWDIDCMKLDGKRMNLKEKTIRLLEQSQELRDRIAEDAKVVHRNGRYERAKNPEARERRARKKVADSLRKKLKENDHQAVRAWRRAGGT